LDLGVSMVRLRTAALFVGLVLGGPAWAGDLQEVRARGELRHLGIRYANFVTGDGAGLDAELVRGFAASLGVKYRLVYAEFPTAVRDLLGREVVRRGDEVLLEGEFPVKGDLIASGFTVLPWRRRVLRYSSPVFPSQVLLVARADAGQRPITGSADLAHDIQETKALLPGKRVLSKEKTCLDPANYGLKGKGIELVDYRRSANLNELVPALLNGEADYTLLDVPDAILDLQRWAGRIKVIGPISEEQQLAVAFPPASVELAQAFEAYLARIRADGTYDRLVDRYYPGIRRYFPGFFAPPAREGGTRAP
jgi:membrane-bound lytic murein transglycosylase MltF